MEGLTPTANTAGIVLTTGTTPAATDGTTPASTDAQTFVTTDAPADVESLPAFAQKIIKDLRDENKKRRQALDDAKRKAEEDKLAEAQQWQTLAEKRAAELSDAQAKIAALDAVTARVISSAETEIDKWPAEIKALRPADATAAALLDWIEQARPLVAKLTAPPPAPGAGPTPKPSNAGNLTADLRQRAQATIQRTF